MNSIITAYQNKDQALVDEYRKAFRLTDRDNVQIFVMPKGKIGKLGGSWVQTPTSGKSQRLTIDYRSCQRKIDELENNILNIPKEERTKKLVLLRRNLKYIENELSAENSKLATMPRSGFIVVERDE